MGWKVEGKWMESGWKVGREEGRKGGREKGQTKHDISYESELSGIH